MKQIFIVLWLVFQLPVSVPAQVGGFTDSASSHAPDTVINSSRDSLPIGGSKKVYLKKMSDYLSLKPGLGNNSEAFIINTDNQKYDFRPNSKTATRLSFNYRFVSFTVSAAPKFIPGNGNNHLKGRSRFRNYSLGLVFNHWVQSIAYTRTKGYYLENTGDFAPAWRPGIDSYVQLPDLVYQSYQGSTAYKFNKNFSFNAISVQTERQLRSAGTFLPGISYKYFFLEDKNPAHLNDSSQRAKNLEFMLSVPYYYTWVLKQKFYVSAGLSPGMGLFFTTVRNNGGSRRRSSETNTLYKFEAALGLGYNGERFFAGLQAQSSNIVYGSKNSDDVLQSARGSYQLFFGYRFGAPKILKRLLDFAEEKQQRLLKKIK